MGTSVGMEFSKRKNVFIKDHIPGNIDASGGDIEALEPLV